MVAKPDLDVEVPPPEERRAEAAVDYTSGEHSSSVALGQQGLALLPLSGCGLFSRSPGVGCCVNVCREMSADPGPPPDVVDLISFIVKSVVRPGAPSIGLIVA